MNTLNRVVIVLSLLVVGAVATLALVWPGATFSFVQGEAEAVLRFIQQWPQGEPLWYVRVGVGAVVAGALDLLLLFLIFLEVRRPSAKEIRVTKAEGGDVTLTVASIVDRLQYEINQIGGVLRSRPTVSARRGGVVVEANVETASGVDVPQKAKEIIGRIHLVVEERMGLRLSREPRVMLRAVSRAEGKGEPEAAQAELAPPPSWPESQPQAGLESMEEPQASSSAEGEE